MNCPLLRYGLFSVLLILSMAGNSGLVFGSEPGDLKDPERAETKSLPKEETDPDEK